MKIVIHLGWRMMFQQGCARWTLACTELMEDTLILPVGPIGQYPVLVQICNEGRISWNNVYVFNMDEYCDWQGRALDPDHPLSFRGFMERNFADKLAPETMVMNSIRSTGENPSALPQMAVTLGMADIFAAKRNRLYCQGLSWQRTVLRIALVKENDVRNPVTLLHNHPDLRIITTEYTAKAPETGTRA